MNFSKLFPQPHPQTAGRVIDGEAVLIMSDDSEINVLNGVGSRIFELSDGSQSVAEIGSIIADEYGISLSEANQDTYDFLKGLVESNVMIFATEREG